MADVEETDGPRPEPAARPAEHGTRSWTRRWPGQYAVAAAVFLALDAVWILGVAGPVYRATMPDLLREPFSLAPAVAFYALFVGVLVHLAVRPGLARGAGAVRHAAVTGGLIGFTSYATYALTNLAVIDGFAVPAALADLVWGGLVGSGVCGIATAVLRRLSR